MLTSFAQEAARFGFRYRVHFEQQPPEEGDVYPLLPPLPEWVEFAALAAISGIAGGVAYDVVKVVVRRIYDGVWAAKKKGPEKLSLSDEEFARFLKYIESFSKGLPDATDRCVRW